MASESSVGVGRREGETVCVAWGSAERPRPDRGDALRKARSGWSPQSASARDALRKQAGVGQRLAQTGVHASSRRGERLRALAHRSGPAGARSYILGDEVGAGREAQQATTPFCPASQESP